MMVEVNLPDEWPPGLAMVTARSCAGRCVTDFP